MSNEDNDLKETQNINSNNENEPIYIGNNTNIEKVSPQDDQKQLDPKPSDESNKIAQQNTNPPNEITGKTQNLYLKDQSKKQKEGNINNNNYNQNNINVTQNQPNQNQVYSNNNVKKESSKGSDGGGACVCCGIAAGALGCCYLIFSCLPCLRKDKNDN